MISSVGYQPDRGSDPGLCVVVLGGFMVTKKFMILYSQKQQQKIKAYKLQFQTIVTSKCYKTV